MLLHAAFRNLFSTVFTPPMISAVVSVIRRPALFALDLRDQQVQTIYTDPYLVYT